MSDEILLNNKIYVIFFVNTDCWFCVGVYKNLGLICYDVGASWLLIALSAAAAGGGLIYGGVKGSGIALSNSQGPLVSNLTLCVLGKDARLILRSSRPCVRYSTFLSWY